MSQEQKSDRDLSREQNFEFLSSVVSQSKPLTGDEPVTKYLNSRGITAIPKTIRLLPEYKQNGQFHPCMIARIDDNDGNRISYHVTHLTQDGKKADVDTVKKVLPCERDLQGGSIKLWKHNGTLAVCEGIETALIYHQDTEISTWSLISAHNMKVWLCPKDVINLIIVADMDSSFTGQSAAYELARKSKALIGKDGYQLERVNVVMVINDSIITDSGKKIDYLDFSQQQQEETTR